MALCARFALLTLLLLLAAPAFAADGRTVAPGFVPQGEGPEAETRDRTWLVNDGSFEQGFCLDGSSAWTCYQSNDGDGVCEWIRDLSTLGLPTLGNWDGDASYWLGGFCLGSNGWYYASSDGFCQVVHLEAGPLGWWWAGYVSSNVEPGNVVTVSIDGTTVYTHEMRYPEDHTAQNEWDVWHYTEIFNWFGGGAHELCFDFQASSGANYFVDYIHSYVITPTEAASFSTIKSRY